MGDHSADANANAMATVVVNEPGAAVAASPSSAGAAAGALGLSAESLPAGCAVMLGDDGAQYVTVVQDGQTYAIPAEEYHAVQRQGGAGATIQIQHAEDGAEVAVPVAVEPPPPPQEEEDSKVAVVTAPVPQVEGATPPPQVFLPQTPVAVAAQAEDGSATPPMVMLQPVPPPPGLLRVTKPVKPPVKVPDNLRPIKVDNWGIFLLNRLQTYFQKKELCDMTIRFPSRNAQIKAHSLVVHACTDYFIERQKRSLEGIVDLPEEFSPDAVAPIVRFMYTGKLDVRDAATFVKLRTAAEGLGMSVLTKLMDAQLHAPPPPPAKSKSKKKNSSASEDDPVKQMKKIKRVERRFKTEETRKAKLAQAKDGLTPAQRSRVKLEEEFAGEDTVPGKKLPIWKKRTSLPPATAAAMPSPNSTEAASDKSSSSNSTNAIPAGLTPVAPPAGKLVSILRKNSWH